MPWLPSIGLPFDTNQTEALIVLIIAFSLLALLLLRLRAARRRRGRAGALPERAAAPTNRHEDPTLTSAASAETPHTLSEAELTAELKRRLAGLPADGSSTSGEAAPDRVVWVEDGDEVLVHLDSLRVQLLDRIMLASVDLESDQTGRQTLVVPLALASGAGPGGLLAVTEESPRGDAALVARWGHTLQEALWAGILAVAGEHAATRGHSPAAISAAPGKLLLHSAAPVAEPVPARVG